MHLVLALPLILWIWFKKRRTGDLILVVPLFSWALFSLSHSNFLSPPNVDWALFFGVMLLAWFRPPSLAGASLFSLLTLLNSILWSVRASFMVDFKNVYLASKLIPAGLSKVVYAPTEFLDLSPELLSSFGLKPPIIRFTYHPFVALALSPLSKLLPPAPLFAGWTLLGFAAMALWLARFRREADPRIFPIAVLTLLHAKLLGAKEGQVNPLLVGLTGSLYFSSGWLAALGLGFTWLFKPITGLASFEFLRRGERTKWLGLLAPLSLASLCVALVLGLEPLRNWLTEALLVGSAPLKNFTYSFRDIFRSIGVPNACALTAQAAVSLAGLAGAAAASLRVPERWRRVSLLIIASVIAMPMAFHFYFHFYLLVWAFWTAKEEGLSWRALLLWFLLTSPTAHVNNFLMHRGLKHIPLAGLEAHLAALWLAWSIVRGR